MDNNQIDHNRYIPFSSIPTDIWNKTTLIEYENALQNIKFLDLELKKRTDYINYLEQRDFQKNELIKNLESRIESLSSQNKYLVSVTNDIRNQNLTSETQFTNFSESPTSRLKKWTKGSKDSKSYFNKK